MLLNYKDVTWMKHHAMDTKLICADRTDGATVQAAAVLALADFKNPFNTATAAVSYNSNYDWFCQG